MPENEISTQPRQLTARIIGSYLRKNHVPSDQIGTLISTVHHALAGLGKPAAEPAATLTPAVPIRRSFSQDQVTCLDCGWKGKMLRGHLARRHALTREEYRARWNLKQDHPLTAPGYSERRSAAAKGFGFGRRRGSSGSRTDAQGAQPESAPQMAEGETVPAAEAVKRLLPGRRRID